MSIVTQLARFGVAGVLVNAAGYGLYLLLTHATSLGPKLTMSLLYAIGVGLSFATNRFWVFGSKEAMRTTLPRFVTAHAMGYGINWALLWLFVDRLGYAHSIVQGIAILVVAGTMFILMRAFVFPRARTPLTPHRS